MKVRGEFDVAEHETLLAMANADPEHALAVAHELLSAHLDSAVKVPVLRAKAIALRVLGRNEEALIAAEGALRHARDARENSLVASAAMTLAPLRAQTGDVQEAMALLDDAHERAAGIQRAEILFQRAGILGLIADFRKACSDYDAAIKVFEESGNEVWLADALMSRGSARACIGNEKGAVLDLTQAIELFARLDDGVGAASAAHNLALASLVSGDPARAVVEFDSAAKQLAAEGFPVDLYRADQCDALLAAGLRREAIDLAQQGVSALAAVGNELEAASQRMVLADARVLSGNWQQAIAEADAARSAFAEHGQDERALRAEITKLHAQLELGGSHRVIADRATHIGKAFRGSGQPEWRSEAKLLEARAYLQGGQMQLAKAVLLRLGRMHCTFSQQVERLELLAKVARSQGRDGDALRASRRALRLVEAANTLDGSSLLRGSMSRHSLRALAVGVELLCGAGRSREAHQMIERSRSAFRSSPAAALREKSSEHRALTRSITDARNSGRDERHLLARIRSLENEIRQEQVAVLQRPVTETPRLHREASLRRYVASGSMVWALDLRKGRSSALLCGATSAIEELTREALFLLRRDLSANGGLSEDLHSVVAELDALMGMPGDLPRRPDLLHIVLAGEVPTFPLGLLPSVAGRVWMQVQRATYAGAPNRRSTGTFVVGGGGLDHGSAEASVVGQIYPEAVIERGSSSTCSRVLKGMNNARLVHIAAHSQVNPGNPMFSSISFADGDLYLHELEGIQNPPSVVVLASCESARTETVGTSPIGLASGLLAAGIDTVIGTACEIPDSEDTVAVMHRLHKEGVAESPAHAVAAVANAGDLSPARQLIAKCLVPVREHPLNEG